MMHDNIFLAFILPVQKWYVGMASQHHGSWNSSFPLRSAVWDCCWAELEIFLPTKHLRKYQNMVKTSWKVRTIMRSIVRAVEAGISLMFK